MVQKVKERIIRRIGESAILQKDKGPFADIGTYFHSCQRIITQNQPGPQDCHGCPYRHFSSDRLQTALLSTYSELTTNDMPEILNAVKQNAFHVACTRVFELTHGLKRGQGIDRENVTHPNQYAAKSRDLLKGNAETSSSGPGIKKEEAMDTS